MFSRSGALLAACLTVAPLVAQEGLTPQQVATMQSVAGAVISPDGSQAAFVKVLPRNPLKENGRARTELHLMDLASGESRPFVTTGSTTGLQWTSDGTGLLFRAKRGEDKHTGLYLLPVDGGEAHRIAGLDDRSISAFDLTPDGKVAMVATETDSEEQKKLEKKGFNQEIYEEDWKKGSVWISALDSEDEPTQLELAAHVTAAHWSPDGMHLALETAPTALVDDSYTSKQIQIVDPQGALVATIGTKGKLGAFAWSPDSKMLAIIAAMDQHDGSAARLFVANVAGATGGIVEPRPVFGDHDRDENDIQWLSDGRLAVRGSSSVQTTVEILTIGSDGAAEAQRILPLDGPVMRSASFSDDGSAMVAVASLPNHPYELYSMQAGGELVRRTDSNPWLADVPMGRQEVVRYPARDGVEVHGLLIHPAERADGARVPLIVSVHGGPEAHLSNGWITRYSDAGQIGAGKGWAVFYPNYRGSTGRGLGYLKLSQGDPAGKEFDDIVDGVDYLINTGLVDGDKVGVTGGSYGGYATAWLTTKYSDRFAGGVMFVGISDKISKVGTTDIPDEEYLVHAMKRPWDNWQLFLERSPIFHAGNSKTPLLILHGKEDPRVDPGQSKEMYRHMKLRSKAPVRLVLYPGEGHGNRQAAAQYDYCLRMLRWFGQYVDGPGGDMPPMEVDYGMKD